MEDTTTAEEESEINDDLMVPAESEVTEDQPGGSMVPVESESTEDQQDDSMASVESEVTEDQPKKNDAIPAGTSK